MGKYSCFYEHLLGELYLSSEADVIIFGGDFNARVGDTADCISDIDELITRCAIDEGKNNYGDNLIDFLKETKMCVLNGRINTEKDYFTCVSNRGKSVVTMCWHLMIVMVTLLILLYTWLVIYY